MARKYSRKLVIDASVLHAAGGHSVHPIGRQCRDALVNVLGICHKAVVTDAIGKEWSKHSSNYSRTWLVEMTRRGKVAYIDAVDLQIVEDAAFQALDEKQRREIIKDLLLIGAALASDRTIISLDDRARRACADLCLEVPEIMKLVWMNPTEKPQDFMDWVRSGAKARKSLTFAAQISSRRQKR
jgi:hypothetical protein